MPASLSEFAPAKVNLTLRVLGRRLDGYHELESLVAFADVGDRLAFRPAERLSLRVHGPTAPQAGAGDDNLVLKAALALAERVPNLVLGAFSLSKRLPVAAGLGGGSSDAAAALRLLARTNALALDDTRLVQAAVATGADVPVCLAPCPRMMRGIGERLSAPFDLPRLPAVLVNPRVAVSTRDVFAALAVPPVSTGRPDTPLASNQAAVLAFIDAQPNDLETPALGLQPVIGDVLRALCGLPACRLARMSGSGATCFALFASGRAAQSAARALRERHPNWWTRATSLG